jgi:hypothetical protein
MDYGLMGSLHWQPCKVTVSSGNIELWITRELLMSVQKCLVLLAFVLCRWMLNCLLMCYLLGLLDTSVTLANPGLCLFFKKNISGFIFVLDCFWSFP